MADKHNISIDKGATFQMAVTWQDENAAAINLTGYTARMQIRKSINDKSPVISLTSSSGITITAISGLLEVLISATDTSAITIENGVYDLEVESGAGIVTRLLEGLVTFNSEVTR